MKPFSGYSYFDKLGKAQNCRFFHKIMCKIGSLWQKIECSELPPTAKVIFWDK